MWFKGLDEEKKKTEGLLKRLKNIEGKNRKLLDEIEYQEKSNWMQLKVIVPRKNHLKK